MDSHLRILLWIAKYGLQAAFALGYLHLFWTVMLELGAGASFNHILIWSLGAFAATTFSIIAISHTVAIILSKTDRIKESNRMVGILEELRAGGRESIDAQRIVNLWYPDQPANSILRLAQKEVMYGKIRRAVESGLITAHMPDGRNPNAVCDIGDTIRFFREQKWLDV